MKDRHSPWFSHNLELLLWGFTTFALLLLLSQFTRDQRMSAALTRHGQAFSASAQSPEIGN